MSDIAPKPGNPPLLWEKIVVTAVAVWIVVLVTYLAVRNEPFKDPNLVVFVRTLLSLSVAVLGATVPGFLHVGFTASGWTIRSGGALALFVVTFFGSPQVLTSLKKINSTVLGPHQYPPESIITHVPTDEQLEAPTSLKPSDVTFSYVNASGVDLKLFVYDFSKRKSSADTFGTPVYWRAWPFPADGAFQTFDRFQNTNGWFGFAVGHFRPDGESLQVYYLATRNIFYSTRPTLVVASSDQPHEPFIATFEVRGE